MSIKIQGNVVIDDSTNITANSLAISNTTASTSNTTGALIVAGGLGVSGNVYANTITGKIISRTSTTTNASSITINSDTTDFYEVTALAVPLTINIPTGSPNDGQKLLIKLKDSGSAQTLTWNTSSGGFRIVGTTLPTTTTASKITYVGAIYNTADNFWDVIAVTTQA